MGGMKYLLRFIDETLFKLNPYHQNCVPSTSRNTLVTLAEIPKLGGQVQVSGKKSPFFKCGKELKERVDYKGKKR